MIDARLFEKGLRVLAAGWGREVDEDTLSAYYGTLAPMLSDDEWRERVRVALATWPPEERRMPPPSWFLRDRVAAVERQLRSNAVRAFEMLGSNNYRGGNAMQGHWLKRALVQENFGEQVLHAYDVAGGDVVFYSDNPRDRSFMQGRFVQALADEKRLDVMRTTLRPVLELPRVSGR